jgi:hypothetical protein
VRKEISMNEKYSLLQRMNKSIEQFASMYIDIIEGAVPKSNEFLKQGKTLKEEYQEMKLNASSVFLYYDKMEEIVPIAKDRLVGGGQFYRFLKEVEFAIRAMKVEDINRDLLNAKAGWSHHGVKRVSWKEAVSI